MPSPLAIDPMRYRYWRQATWHSPGFGFRTHVVSPVGMPDMLTMVLAKAAIPNVASCAASTPQRVRAKHVLPSQKNTLLTPHQWSHWAESALPVSQPTRTSRPHPQPRTPSKKPPPTPRVPTNDTIPTSHVPHQRSHQSRLPHSLLAPQHSSRQLRHGHTHVRGVALGARLHS